MNPYLTGAGRALLTSAIVFVAVGVIGGLWPLLLLGVLQVLLLALSYHALLGSSLALERRLLVVEVGPEEGADLNLLRTGKPSKLALRVHNRSGATLRGIVLTPHMGSALEMVEPVPVNIVLPGYSAVQCDMTLKSTLTGRWFLHGFKVTVRDVLGLIAVGEYVATPTALKFMPDVFGSSTRALSLRRSRVRDREGIHKVRQMGFGTDLRELRDHQHGDPFRAIAWKATARTGRLMVKDYESEMVLGTYLCLDVSSTMRGGNQGGGRNKLEHAVGLATAYADLISRNNDRIGLITFDEKIHGHIRPKDNKAQMRQILQHLIGVRHIVDEDLTEYTDVEISELLARYLLVHERLDFRRKAVRRRMAAGGVNIDQDKQLAREILEIDHNAYDLDLLSEWVASVLKDEKRRFDDPALHMGVPNYKRLTPVRRFCHLRGVEIPYRVETRLGQKERGLVQCFEEIMAHTRESHLILVITDLCGIMNTELIVRGLRLAQSRRHSVAFIAPFTPDYVPLQGDQHDPTSRQRIIHELFSVAEGEERQQISKAIEGLGIPVIQIGPDDQLPGILRRLNSTMRRR